MPPSSIHVRAPTHRHFEHGILECVECKCSESSFGMQDDVTALHTACYQEGNFEVVKELLAFGGATLAGIQAQVRDCESVAEWLLWGGQVFFYFYSLVSVI
jgi:hypothetical protein